MADNEKHKSDFPCICQVLMLMENSKQFNNLIKINFEQLHYCYFVLLDILLES